MHGPATLSAHCLNCQHRLAGPYCHHCGQPASTPARITMHDVLHELPHSVWHVDRGVIYTVRELLLRPGITIVRYLRGERAAFFRPVALVLLLAGINSFLFLSLHIVPFSADSQATSALRAAQVDLLHFIARYQAWVQISVLPLNAAIANALLRRHTGLTYPEQLTASILLAGSYVATQLLFIPALWYTSGQPLVAAVAAVMTVVLLLIKVRGYAQLQIAATGSRPGSAWARALITVALEYALTFSLLLGMLGALMLLHK